VDWALTVLAVQFILACAATMATVLSVTSLVAAGSLIVSDNAGSDAAWFIFIPLVIVAPMVGLWLTAGLGHHRRWIVWLAWFAWVTCLVTIIVAAPLLITGTFSLESIEVGAVSSAELSITAFVFVFAIWLAALTGFMTAAAVGVPLGRVLLWLLAQARSQQWRWRRRLRRKALVAE
jgi:hypothetical protein